MEDIYTQANSHYLLKGSQCKQHSSATGEFKFSFILNPAAIVYKAKKRMHVYYNY